MEEEIERSREAYNVFVTALRGNKGKEKDLINILKEETNSIRYQYISRAKKVGLQPLDLEDMVIQAVFVLFAKGSSSKIKEDSFLNFFRYIYLKVLQQEIRKEYRRKDISFSDYLRLREDPFFRITDLEFHDDTAQASKYFLEDDICQSIVYENKCGLSDDERHLLVLYLNGYSIYEQAEESKTPPTTAYNRFKNAIEKVRCFLKSRGYFDKDNF